MSVGAQEDLARWMDWLYTRTGRRCRCDHAYKGLGSLHGIQMGKGWVRTMTHPDCEVHAKCQGYTPAIEAAYKKDHPWSIGRWCPVHKNKVCPER